MVNQALPSSRAHFRHHLRQHSRAAVFNLFPASTHVTDEIHTCDELSGWSLPRVTYSSDTPLLSRDSRSAPASPQPRDAHLDASPWGDVIPGITWTLICPKPEL